VTNKLDKLYLNKEVKTWKLLMETFSTIYSRLEVSLGNEGMSMTRFQVMLIIYFQGPISPNSLAQKLLVTRGNISMLLRRMENDELITYIEVDGKKRPSVLLSKNGAKLFEKIFPEHIARVKKLVKPLSKTSTDELLILTKHAKEAKL